MQDRGSAAGSSEADAHLRAILRVFKFKQHLDGGAVATVGCRDKRGNPVVNMAAFASWDVLYSHSAPFHWLLVVVLYWSPY